VPAAVVADALPVAHPKPSPESLRGFNSIIVPTAQNPSLDLHFLGARRIRE
jgi:hypothetical protein